MFDKVFKHEVLFIGYLILACLMTNVWSVLWFGLVALVHAVLMMYCTIKKAPKHKQQEDNNLKQQENV